MKTVNQLQHILIVEDEAPRAELILRSFESRSDLFNVKIVGSLKEAKKYLSQTTPDLIIANLTFPDGKWSDLLISEDKTSRFPFVIMAGLEDEQMAIEAIKTGAMDYIVKSDIALANMAQNAERILGRHLNIIRLKKAEKELTESEARYRLLYERAPLGYQSLDKNGCFLEVNQTWLDNLGYTRDEVIGT